MLLTFYFFSILVGDQCVNTTCSFGCRAEGNGTVCFCPIGKLLKSDNVTCEGR